MSKKISVKFTRLGRREARLIRREREFEAAMERERWALEEARKKLDRKLLSTDVKRLWAEYDRRKDPRTKDEIARIIIQAEEEGIELASP